ncbi:MAG: hypothetical protein CL508_05660 [Actinobacteria bacterium]|nr:hypothetical protein [Actinomycetota bacterium]|tara:strand:- start:136 stop:1410 length:1275 start_codon:yes stop_codon:yes gene_type:complete
MSDYDLKLDEGSYLVYVEETGELFIAYDDGNYSLLFETDNSLASLTYFNEITEPTTREIEAGIEVTATPNKELQEKSYIQQLANKGLAMIIDTKENFYTAKGIGDLQPFVFVDYDYSQLNLAIDSHGSKAISRFVKKLEDKANNAPWWKDAAYRNEAAQWYKKYGATGYQLWLDTTHDKWLEDNGYDPRTYKAWKEYSKSETKWNDKLSSYKTQLEEYVGVKGGELSDEALEYAANEWAWGRWDAAKARRQVLKAVDPGEEGDLDAGFMSFLDGTEVTETTLKESEVQEDLDTYLPSDLHSTYNVKEIAQKYRNDPSYRMSFIEGLKEDRYAQYPMYDKNLAWNRIVAGKKSMASQVWGIDISNIKDNDAGVIQLLMDNDPSTAMQTLRQIGLDRGYAKTMGDFANALASSYGTGVVRSAGFRE